LKNTTSNLTRQSGMRRRGKLKLTMKASWALVLAVAAVAGCTSQTTETNRDPITIGRSFSSETLYSAGKAPKCKAMLDSYCNTLYSPEAQGNLAVKQSSLNTIEVLQGDTGNEFRYAKAKLKSRANLPNDFRNALDRNGYFAKLRTYLARPSRKAMSLTQRLDYENTNFELNYIWTSALNEAILSRMTAKYPGYHRISEANMPIELQLERRRLRRAIISELSRAIWHDDKNWQKVEQGFDRLRVAFLRMISRLDIAKAVADDWSDRISSIQLALPGSTPAISDEECSSTTVNAYYFTYLNILTVCAGDFNSEDILQTLAHEMAHSLGIDRATYLFEVNSDFGKQLSTFRANVCKPETFSCEQWSTYKSSFQRSLSSLDGYQPQMREFNQCLKRRPTSKELTEEDIGRFARTIVNDRMSDLASGDRFLRLTKAQIPMRSGKSEKNPNYLNPCEYSLWTEGEEPIHDPLTTMLYFTAEYRCSDKTGADKFKSAIEVSKQMTTDLFRKVLRAEGEFSSRSLLENQGYSSPPFERFADVMGSYALAEHLKLVPEKWNRRNVYLASSSWQCIEPSLASRFPDESAVENEYIFDDHTGGDLRQKELFSTPIRETIGCEKDFEFNECSIPRKPGAEEQDPSLLARLLREQKR
jgi:hypothetical protein